MIKEVVPLNDPPLCAECNLPIKDNSYNLWKSLEHKSLDRLCSNCRKIRVEQLRLRNIAQEETNRAEKRTFLNLSALKKAASAVAAQLEARGKWGRRMILLEATFSDVARSRRIRYFFANDIPTYIRSMSGRHTLYLRNVAEFDPFQEVEK